MEYNYLFLINENSIEAYKLKNDGFEIVKFKGETAYIGDFKNFWRTWEDNIAYIPEIGKVDFCIISKVNAPKGYEEFPCVGKSKWTEKVITRFFKEVKLTDISFIKKIENIYIKDKNQDGLFRVDISPKHGTLTGDLVESTKSKAKPTTKPKGSVKNTTTTKVVKKSKVASTIEKKPSISEKQTIKKTVVAKKVEATKPLSIADFYKMKSQNNNK